MFAHRRGHLMILLDYKHRLYGSTSVNCNRLGQMSPKVNTEDLVGAVEVAALLGLSHYNSVTTYLNRYDDFPTPVVDLSRSRVRLWLRQDILDWKQRRREDHRG